MTVDGGDPMEYAYDNANKMLSAGTATFGYDNNGNTRTKTEPGIGQTGYVYNYENKITTILYPSGRGVSNYLYDGDGVRRKKVDATGTRWFVYDGANIIAETDLIGNLQVVYTYGLDGLVSSRAGGQSYFYHFDGLGSTRAMTNEQAQLVEVYDYEAFGNELLSQGGLATPYRYVGQLGYYRHDDVELDLLGARYYAPEFGRFLTRDPAARAFVRFGYPPGGKWARVPNGYWYADQHPVWLTDRSGLMPQCRCWPTNKGPTWPDGSQDYRPPVHCHCQTAKNRCCRPPNPTGDIGRCFQFICYATSRDYTNCWSCCDIAYPPIPDDPDGHIGSDSPNKKCKDECVKDYLNP